MYIKLLIDILLKNSWLHHLKCCRGNTIVRRLQLGAYYAAFANVPYIAGNYELSN